MGLIVSTFNAMCVVVFVRVIVCVCVCRCIAYMRPAWNVRVIFACV
jgi:hypothetical protein